MSKRAVQREKSRMGVTHAVNEKKLRTIYADSIKTGSVVAVFKRGGTLDAFRYTFVTLIIVEGFLVFR